MGPQKITIAAASVLLALGSVAMLHETAEDTNLRPRRAPEADPFAAPLESAEGLAWRNAEAPAVAVAVEETTAQRIDFTPAAPGGAAPPDADSAGFSFVEVRLDGDSQALIPAPVRDVLERGVDGTPGVFHLTSTRHAIQRVAEGRADLAIVSSAGELTGSGAAVGHAMLGSWIPALVVHPDNPLRNVPSRKLRDLLRGAIQDWSELGGRAGPIRMVVPGDDDGRAAVARAFVPGDSLGVGIPAATEEDRLYKVLNDPFALTVVSTSLAHQVGGTVLTVDGVQPSAPARRRGTYPFGADLYLVHGANPDPATRKLLDRLLGDERDRLIGTRLEKP